MKRKILSLIAAMVPVLSIVAVGVETDRAWYLVGETMTVSVTADDALIAYAELCDMHSLAAGTMVSLESGVGKGIIELPADLHSGYYVLSAYTRGHDEVSSRLVAIVNPLRKSADDDIAWVEITHSDSLAAAQNGSWAGEGESTDAERPWTDEFAGMGEKAADMRETEGHIVSARIKNVCDGHVFSGSQIRPSLSIIGKQIHYFDGQMIDDSTAVFYTFGLHGRQPLVLSAVSSTGVTLPVEVISPYVTLLPKRLPHLVFHYERNEVETRSLDMQRHQRLRVANGSMPSDYDETVAGTKPDLNYNLDEYRQFLTVREVLLEYVANVSKKKINGVTRLLVGGTQDYDHNILPTLVLIDGMPVNDTEQLLNYDARRVHYINIYDGQYTFGHGIYHGILSFVTRSGQLTNYPTERNMQYIVYDFP